MNGQQAVHAMINSIVGAINKRMLRGEFDYQKDAVHLKQLIRQAGDISAYETEGGARHTLGMMHILAGYPSRGIVEQENALKNYAQARSAALLVSGTINLAVTYRLLGRYIRALKLLAEAEALATREAIDNEHGTLSLLHSTLGLTYVNVGKYEEAQTAFEHALDSFTRHAPDFALAAVQARCGMARLDARHERFHRAWERWRIAEYSIEGQFDPMRRFIVNSTAVYLAALDTRGGHEGATAYLDEAEGSLMDLPPTYALLMLLDEMRLWKQDGSIKALDRYETLVNTILAKQPTTELRQLVTMQL